MSPFLSLTGKASFLFDNSSFQTISSMSKMDIQKQIVLLMEKNGSKSCSMNHKTPLASLKHFQKDIQTKMFLLYFSISNLILLTLVLLVWLYTYCLRFCKNFNDLRFKHLTARPSWVKRLKSCSRTCQMRLLKIKAYSYKYYSHLRCLFYFWVQI